MVPEVFYISPSPYALFWTVVGFPALIVAIGLGKVGLVVYGMAPPPKKRKNMVWTLYFVSLFCLVGGSTALVLIAAPRTRAEISQDRLQIHSLLHGHDVSLKSLIPSEAKMLKWSDIHIGARLNGNSGSGPKMGWFEINDEEKALLIVTDVTELSQIVYLPTQKDYSILLTLDQPREFLSALNETFEKLSESSESRPLYSGPAPRFPLARE